MSDLRELYQEMILAHSRSPRNYRTMDPVDRSEIVQFMGAVYFIRHMANAMGDSGSLITISSLTAIVLSLETAADVGEAVFRETFTAAEHQEIDPLLPFQKRRREKLAGKVAVKLLAAEWLQRGKPTLLGASSGAVAGLVCITPAAGFVELALSRRLVRGMRTSLAKTRRSGRLPRNGLVNSGEDLVGDGGAQLSQLFGGDPLGLLLTQ